MNPIQREFLEAWILSDPYGRYRNYPTLPEEKAFRLAMDTLCEESEEIRGFWFGPDTSPTGLIRVLDLHDDSDLFNMRMGVITHICGEIPPSRLRSCLKDAGYQHMVTRIDCSDVPRHQFLLKEDFLHVDSILTYLYVRVLDPMKRKRSERCRPFVFRHYEPDDRESVLEITRNMYRHYPSRYYRDPLLQHRSMDRYVIWMENYLDGGADKILVAELEGSVTAFLAYRYDRRFLQSTGLVSYGTGLGASTEQGMGAYGRLLYNSIQQVSDDEAHFGEFDTQIDNYSVQRLYQQIELRYVRAQYTFHLHLMDSSP